MYALQFGQFLLLVTLLQTLTLLALPLGESRSEQNEVPRTAEGKRIYYTQRIRSEPPRIDGRLDDSCWEEGEWSGHYTQYMPEEGKPPSQETEIKILYDDENVYVAFRVYDTEPEKIDRKLGRRDAFAGDIIGVCFDSYFDHRTGFEFDLTASGAKIDLLLFNNNQWDTSWDPVWFGKVGSASFGWTAEMQIPLSQLRYGNKETHVWGLHSWRWINRNREEAQWNMIGRDSPGHLYSIGELHGIEGIRNSRSVELLPYVVGRVTSTDEGAETSREAGTHVDGAAGLDGKIGLSSAFTLDFTVNPDFGQVEADPSVLNLTDFEVFYEEKRPFFLEGKNIFDFRLGDEQLFYSRRIGHAPSYSPVLKAGESLVQGPTSTSILGALKLTGKTKDGLSVGVIESVTSSESAEIRGPLGSREELTEPFANYLVGRIQQDFGDGNTFLGGMITAALRRIQDAHLEFLPGSAFTGGMDFRHHWNDKAYFVDARILFSDVSGSDRAISGLQQASARYFQRPDADHLTFDPARTNLRGHGGAVSIGKGSRGRWRFSESFDWRSPGFELNDLGYLRRADIMTQRTSVGYVVTEPKSVLREFELSFEQENSWDFSGEFLEPMLSVSASGTFENKWSASVSLLRIGRALDTRLLRGGPAVNLMGFWSTGIRFHTDPARRVGFNFNYHSHLFDDGESKLDSYTPGVQIRVTDPFLFSANVSYSINHDIFQYVDRQFMANEPRDLVARIDQDTIEFTFRVDYAVTPEFTIQYYGSPFASVGTYRDFKRFTDPRADDYADLYHTFSGDEINYDPVDRRYDFDENLDGIIDYSVSNPDFNFREFRSNLVGRWEYKPGSVLYIVWTQGRSLFDGVSNVSLRDSLGNLFTTPAENVFLVKLSYWLPL